MSYYSTSTYGLIIKPSKILGAGLGVYTLETIPKDAVIGEYLGRVTSTRIKDHDYTVYVNKRCSIDAKEFPRCYMAMINDAHGTSFVNNCSLRKVGCRVYVIALTEILPDQELYVSYGSGYWASRSKWSVLPT